MLKEEIAQIELMELRMLTEMKKMTKTQIRKKLLESKDPLERPGLNLLGLSSLRELLKDQIKLTTAKFKSELLEALNEDGIPTEKIIRAISIAKFQHMSAQDSSKRKSRKAAANSSDEKQQKIDLSSEEGILQAMENLQLVQTIHYRPLVNLCMGPIIEHEGSEPALHQLEWTQIDVQKSEDHRWKLSKRMSESSKKCNSLNDKLRHQPINLDGYVAQMRLQKQNTIIDESQEQNSVTKSQLLSLVAEPGHNALVCCRILLDNDKKTADDMASHILLDHKPIDFKRFSYRFAANQVELNNALKNLGRNREGPKTFSQQVLASLNGSKGNEHLSACHLVLACADEPRIIIRYRVLTTQTRRVCIIENLWSAKKHYLDLAIALARLEISLQLRRVPEMALLAGQNSAWYFSRLGFFKTNDNEILRLLKTSGQVTSGKQPISKKSEFYLEDTVPLTISPKSLNNSKQGNLLRNIMKTLRDMKFPQLLEKYKEFQVVPNERVSNKVAIVKDQAVTPDEIFEKIQETIFIRRDQLFDVCKFQPNWNELQFYNALKDDWVGNFIYCNPPFSVAAWFITEMILQFFKGKNIVAILPQESTDCSFGKPLLRLLGVVHSLGLIPFQNFNTNLPTAVSIVFLLQPEHIDFIKGKSQDRHLPEKQKLVKNWDSIRRSKTWVRERDEFALRLLSARYKQREIQQLVYTNSNQLGILMKTRLQEFYEQHRLE